MDVRVVMLKLERLNGLLRTQRKFQELEVESDSSLIKFLECHVEGLAKVRECQQKITSFAIRRGSGTLDHFKQRQNSSPLIEIRKSITAKSSAGLKPKPKEALQKQQLDQAPIVNILGINGNINFNFPSKKSKLIPSAKQYLFESQKNILPIKKLRDETLHIPINKDTIFDLADLTEQRARFTSGNQTTRDDLSFENEIKSSLNYDQVKPSPTTSAKKRAVMFELDTRSNSITKIKQTPLSSNTASRNSPSIYSKTRDNSRHKRFIQNNTSEVTSTAHLYLNRDLDFSQKEEIMNVRFTNPSSTKDSPRTSQVNGLLFRKLSRQCAQSIIKEYTQPLLDLPKASDDLAKSQLVESPAQCQVVIQGNSDILAKKIELFRSANEGSNLN